VNQYHNKAFKKQAEAFGLKVERMRNKGYAKTSLDEKAGNLVKKYKNKYCKDDKNPFHAYRVTEERINVVKKCGKRFIAIDGHLAEEAEDAFPGQTIRQTVENLLRSAISEQRVLEVA